jgi:hypothetical protein
VVPLTELRGHHRETLDVPRWIRREAFLRYHLKNYETCIGPLCYVRVWGERAQCSRNWRPSRCRDAHLRWLGMKLRVAPLLFTVLAHPALAQAPSDKPAGCTVRGEVLQEPGDKPVRKVTVQLISSVRDESVAYSAATDVEGRFSISDYLRYQAWALPAVRRAYWVLPH